MSYLLEHGFGAGAPVFLVLRAFDNMCGVRGNVNDFGSLEYGAPFDDYDGMLRYIRGNMARKKDNVIVSEGPPGVGKSTTTGNLIKDLNPAFNVRTHTIFTVEELLEALAADEEGVVYDLDEAINIFHNQDWSTWIAKALTKLLRQMRIKRCTWVLNVPDFEGLHPYLRDHRAQIRFYHPPFHEADGLGNGPSQVLWRNIWFDYSESRQKTRWVHLFDMKSHNLDDDPFWSDYEEKKRASFRDQVQAMRRRMKEEAKQAAKRTAKATKPKKSKA